MKRGTIAVGVLAVLAVGVALGVSTDRYLLRAAVDGRPRGAEGTPEPASPSPDGKKSTEEESDLVKTLRRPLERYDPPKTDPANLDYWMYPNVICRCKQEPPDPFVRTVSWGRTTYQQSCYALLTPDSWETVVRHYAATVRRAVDSPPRITSQDDTGKWQHYPRQRDRTECEDRMDDGVPERYASGSLFQPQGGPDGTGTPSTSTTRGRSRRGRSPSGALRSGRATASSSW